MLLALLSMIASAPVQGPPLTTELVLDGLNDPVWAGAPPGDDRLFVCERDPGRILVAKNGILAPFPFLDLSALVGTNGERGLFSVAFHPGFASNGLFFVYYSDPADNTVLARYQVSQQNPDRADPNTALILYQQYQPGFMHTLGDLEFGPLDGFLYASLGKADVPGSICHGQTTGDLRGKVLRLDVDGGTPYAIPPDNPFATSGEFPAETWSLGMRNAWRIAFDQLTGDLYMGDVGGSAWEEVNYEPALTGGRHYGWKILEGPFCHGPDDCPAGTPGCGAPGYTQPLHAFDHTVGCAMIGGEVYRGNVIAGLGGTYFFGDWCTASIWSLRVSGGAATEFTDRTIELAPGGALDINSISSFGLDGDGEILVVDYTDGEIFRIRTDHSAGGDCDDNGIDDAQEIAANPLLDIDGSGALDECEGLAGDAASISVATGGALGLTVHAGGSHAGKAYLVLGSTSGTSPGLMLQGVLVPLLSNDAYFLYTMANPNNDVLVNTLGILDPAGRAQATIDLPPLPPTLAGKTAHHAAVVISTTAGKLVDDATHALPLLLAP